MNRFAFHYEKLTVEQEAQKVFDDPRRVRIRRFRMVLAFGLISFVTWVCLLLNGAFSLQTAVEDLNGYWGGKEELQTVLTPPTNAPDELRLASLRPFLPPETSCDLPSQPYFAAMADPASPVVFGHIPSDTDGSHLSLADSCNQLGVLVPDWLQIEAGGSAPKVILENAANRAPVEDYRSGSGHASVLMPTISIDASEDETAFYTSLSTPDVAQSTTQQILDNLRPIYAQGACLDFHGLQQSDLAALQPFLQTLSSGFRTEGMASCIILSGTTSVWQDAEMMALFDKVILKLFLDPWVGAAPSPLATDPWFAETAAMALEALGKDKLVVALGSFAVEWVSGTPLPKTLSYAAAMEQIAEADAQVRFSSKTSGSFASYRDEIGRTHKVWMQDAATLHNQLKTLADLGIFATGIWSLGMEDPGVWTVLRSRDKTPDALSAGLALVKLENHVSYTGEGALLRLAHRQSPGIRQVRMDEVTGRVSAQEYDILPRPYALERYGKPEGRKLVLTFDDGPHPVFSQQILDILKDTETPAAFFVTGKSVMDAPDVLNRMINEGHEIGAHTFSHPRMDEVSQTRATLEYAMLDKVVAGAAGRKPMLYREPFQRSKGPISADRVAALEIAWERGLQVVGMDIVPHDWSGWSGREIADYVVKQVEEDAKQRDPLARWRTGSRRLGRGNGAHHPRADRKRL